MSAAKLKVTTSSKPNSRIAVEVEVPADRCKNSYDEALSKLSRSISIPGFRKGKVPKAVVIQQLGVKRIQASALESLLQKVWTEALDQIPYIFLRYVPCIFPCVFLNLWSQEKTSPDRNTTEILLFFFEILCLLS